MAYHAELFGSDADNAGDVPFSYADIRIIPPIATDRTSLESVFIGNEIKSVISTEKCTLIELEIYGSFMKKGNDPNYPSEDVAFEDFPGYIDHDKRMRTTAEMLSLFLEKLNGIDDEKDISWTDGVAVDLQTINSKGE
jgi:hypothetical protein